MDYRWTPRRDRELQDLRRDGFAYAEIGRMMGCTREEAIGRAWQLRASPPPKPDVCAVPRPVAAPRPAFVPRVAKIDISRAPSAMEEAAAAWDGGVGRRA